MEVQKMDAEKYQAYVTKEFKKVLSCKLSTLATEETKRIGTKPAYTPKEKEAIINGRQHVIRLSILEQFKEELDNIDIVVARADYLSEHIQSDNIDDMLLEAISGFFAHPDYPAWEKRSTKISEEFRVREIALEKTVDNVVRNFCTGLLSPQSLNRELDKIETTEF